MSMLASLEPLDANDQLAPVHQGDPHRLVAVRGEHLLNFCAGHFGCLSRAIVCPTGLEKSMPMLEPIFGRRCCLAALFLTEPMRTELTELAVGRLCRLGRAVMATTLLGSVASPISRATWSLTFAKASQRSSHSSAKS